MSLLRSSAGPSGQIRPLRAVIAELPGVRARRLFGSEAFFVGPVMFAFESPDGVVLRLSDAARESALQSGQAHGFLGQLPDELSGWVVVPRGIDLGPWLGLAHTGARGLARRMARRKPVRRRRRVAA